MHSTVRHTARLLATLLQICCLVACSPGSGGSDSLDVEPETEMSDAGDMEDSEPDEEDMPGDETDLEDEPEVTDVEDEDLTDVEDEADGADTSDETSGDVAEETDLADALDVATELPIRGETGPVPTEFTGQFIAHGDFFHRWNGTSYEQMFIRGVDLGVGMPGTQPGHLAPQYDDYMNWFAQMKETGFDVVRIYTLHYPRFHEAVRDYNTANPDDPLYILQGVWLREQDPGGTDLHDLNDDFTQLTEETIDAAHGNVTIAERRGRAWGTYEVDISEWVMGYIIGREVYGREAVGTDSAHPEDTSYEGTSVRLLSGNPASVWAAARLDHALTYEAENYDTRIPMAFASWMELDPMTHPTERVETGKDIGTIDLSELDSFGAPQGHFYSFHVYPYYPRFINEEPAYQRFEDELGNNSYLGYLVDLKRHYTGLPIMVTEFGVPSSWGVARDSTSGMHQGGHTETEQGAFAARMLNDIHRVGYTGAVVFHWMDGWFKRIWITRERAFPSDRMPLWHDMMHPQQSYGLMAFDLGPPDFEVMPEVTGDGRIARVRAAADAEYFHVELTLDEATDEPIIVAFDTYDDELGESQLPNGVRSPRAVEFVLEIGESTAELSVMSSYDLYSILGAEARGTPVFRSTVSDGGGWLPWVWNTATEHVSGDGLYTFPAEDFEAGHLIVRRAGDETTSQDAVVVDGLTITIRVPWLLLHFTDPSTLSVFHSSTGEGRAREARVTEGIGLVVNLGDTTLETPRFTWDGWDQAPETTDRLKASVEVLGEALELIDPFPVSP